MHAALNERLLNLLGDLFGEHRPRSWLSGGSLLMADLGVPYHGDYDVLIEGTKNELAAALKRRDVSFYVSMTGTLKVPLTSGETIDLRPAGRAEPDDVLAILKTYHFDIVSAAREIGGQQRIVSTEARRKSIASRRFGFNEAYEPCPQFAAGILTAMAVYEHYLRFSCADLRSRQFREAYRIVLAPPCRRPEDSIRSIYAELDRFSDVMMRSTLCRGAVRRTALGGISEWDDFDVLLPMETAEAIGALERDGILYSLNHFGMPKVRGRLGRFYDLICYEASPAETCSSFCMNSDRMFWSREDAAPHDLGGYLSNIPPELHLSAAGDALRLDRDERYYLIKAVFLCVLEGARLSEDATAALRRSCPLDIRDRRNISNLSIELIARKMEGELAACLDQLAGAEADSVIDGYSQFYRGWRAYIEGSSDR